MAEQLDVRTGRRKHLEADRRDPGEEEAEVLSIRLRGASAVARQDRRRRQLGQLGQVLVHLPLNEYLVEPEPDPIR